MTTKSEAMLGKVRGLLAKAADPNIDPREADLFRQKADELMVKYAIEQWQIEKPDANDREIASREYDFSWYSESGHGGALWSIMLSVARHCRVKVVHWQAYTSSSKIPIVGLKSDMDWFDLLFTNVMTDFVSGLEPRPNASMTFPENVARLKESGMQWKRIAELLWHADMLSKTKYPYPPTQTQVHNMGLATVYTKFCDETNRPRLRITPQIYRRSYSAGYDNRPQASRFARPGFGYGACARRYLHKGPAQCDRYVRSAATVQGRSQCQPQCSVLVCCHGRRGSPGGQRGYLCIEAPRRRTEGA